MAAAVAALGGSARAQWNESLGPVAASRPAGAAEKFIVRPILSARTVQPGDWLYVAVEITVAPKYWAYGPAPGGKIVQTRPMTIRPQDSPFRLGEVLFPPTHPHTSDLGRGQTDTHNVYEGTVWAYVPVTVPMGARPGRYDLSIKVEAQVCDPDTCLLPAATTVATIEVAQATVASPNWTGGAKEGVAEAKTAQQWLAFFGAGAAAATPAVPATRPAGGKEVGAYLNTPQWRQILASAESGSRGTARGAGSSLATWEALPLAFLAGMVLNIMPCVLPVVPLKVLSIIQQARASRRRFVLLGLSFVAGVILFFVALAALNIVLKTVLGYTFQWGDHFRQPGFIIAMTLLLVALAANMFGAFTVTVPGKVASAETGAGYAGALGTGLLTAVLSTPCSFAILTSAFAWAQAQPLWLGTVAILAIGAGMAAPYAVLTGFPRLLARVPRAGRWTELFKQAMGFVLLVVAAWLLGTQMEGAYPAWVAAYAVVLAFCLWMWGSWVRYDAPAGRRRAVRLVAAAAAVASGWWMLTPPSPLAVQLAPFDPQEIVAAHGSGRAVLIDFTASWCLTCRTVEWRVYDDRQVADALAARNVLAVKGDVTASDLPAGPLLKALGEPGVPVTVIFPPGSGPPVRLHGVFTKADLLKALDSIRAAP